MFDLRDRFESVDGSRPTSAALSEDVAKRYPLPAFTILSGGDVFERGVGQGRRYVDEATRCLDDKLTVIDHGASGDEVTFILKTLTNQLAHNSILIARLSAAKPIVVDIVPEGATLSSVGLPKNLRGDISGVFWDKPDWEKARIAYRRERLENGVALVVHEMAHAIHYLAFTKKERDLIYRVLRPTFGNRSAMDEVFAIYSEREFLGAAFDAKARRAPGVYGFTRSQWNENHLFTRFVRKLYFPNKRLAGPTLGPGAWSRFSGG